MTSCRCAYEPQEDSTMLEKHVRKHAFGEVLDMGTGSGIQAIAAAQSSKVTSVIAADIQKETINYCKAAIQHRKIKFIQSDLFSKIRGKFATIIFNPPYLPADIRVRDIALDGGKHGYEVLENFLNLANNFLSEKGIMLVLFSSLTRKEKVDEIIKNNLLDSIELERMNFFFEELYVCMLRKSEILRKIESKRVSDVRYLAKGHRGLVFTGMKNKTKIVVKMKNPKSKAEGRIQNELKWLKLLNKKGIGPRLLFSGDDFFSYKYIDGEFIADYLKKSSKNEIKKILRKVFRQMYLLDCMNVDKEEMHHPLKHVIVSKGYPYLIDFERVHKVKRPKNVTQFCQFVLGGHITKILESKGINLEREKIIGLAKIYKKDRAISSFRKIVRAL